MAALHEKLASQRAELRVTYAELERSVDGQQARQAPQLDGGGPPPQQAQPTGSPVGDDGGCNRHPESHREDGSLQPEQAAGSREEPAVVNPRKWRCCFTGPFPSAFFDLTTLTRHKT